MNDIRAPLTPVMERARPLLDAVRLAGGHPTIVGGAVRDALRGIAAEDADIEVSGLSMAALIAALETVGRVNIVGQAFGVVKVALPGGPQFDVSVPRKENKIGKGHRAFAVEFGTLSPREAAARRDFTINAMAYHPSTGELIDPYDGQGDLAAGILRHTSTAFAEDPLRVLRAMQFAARFNLRLAPETAALARSLLPEAGSLPLERIWEEWRKWAVQGESPSLGLRVLVETGWIELYPELAALVECPQDSKWHPEGTVFEHTLAVCDAAAGIADRAHLPSEERLILLLAALCHDLGKAVTTVIDADGRIRSPGHAADGVPLTETLLARIGCRRDITTVVLPLVREHLAHLTLPAEPRPVRRLALRLEPAGIAQWGRLVAADHSGRPPLPPSNPAAPIVELAAKLAVEHTGPDPLLLGRHLVERGVPPGPELGRMLKAAYEAQIDGEFETVEGALTWMAYRLP